MQGAEIGTRDQVERGRDKGRGDRDTGKGKLGPRTEGQISRQTEEKSRIEIWDGLSHK